MIIHDTGNEPDGCGKDRCLVDLKQGSECLMMELSQPAMRNISLHCPDPSGLFYVTYMDSWILPPTCVSMCMYLCTYSLSQFLLFVINCCLSVRFVVD